MSQSQSSRHPADVLGSLLVRSKLLSQDEFDAARKAHRGTGDNIETVLVREGFIDASTLARFVSRLEEMTKVKLAGFDLDEDVIALVPGDFAISHRVIPVDKMGRTLTIASAVPVAEEAVGELEEMVDLRIKPMLASEADISAALERYYGVARPDGNTSSSQLLEAPLRLTMAVSMLRHIDQLPGLPGTVQRIREMLYSEDGSAAEAGDVIARDPAITAKVLKVANSAAYGFPNRVDNIGLAVSLLGLIETYSVVVSTSVINIFDRSKTFDYMNFWMESMVCATMANAISRSIDSSVRTGIFSAGLLRDIGRVALAEVAPKHYARVDRSRVTGFELIRQEEELIGLTHTEAGYQLAQHWGLPEDIAQAIRFHHTPAFASPDSRALVSIVNIADAVSRSHRADSEDRTVDFSECRESMHYLEMNEDDVHGIFNTVPEIDEGDAFWKTV